MNEKMRCFLRLTCLISAATTFLSCSEASSESEEPSKGAGGNAGSAGSPQGGSGGSSESGGSGGSGGGHATGGNSQGGTGGSAGASGTNGHLFLEDFTDCAGTYSQGDAFGLSHAGLSQWFVIAASHQWKVLPAEQESISAMRGENVAFFTSPSDAFGENRLDRCVVFDPLKPLSFLFHLYSNVSTITDDLRVRINPNFYDDFDLCEGDLRERKNDNRLSGELSNADVDVRLASAGIESDQWFALTESTHGDLKGVMRFVPDQYPQGATVLRFSLRVRDDKFASDVTRRLYVDDIRVTQSE